MLNVEEEGFPENVTGKCQQNYILDNSLPYWNITGINFPFNQTTLCLDTTKCKSPIEMSPLLVNTWDRLNTSVGVKVRYFCGMNNTRG